MIMICVILFVIFEFN